MFTEERALWLYRHYLWLEEHLPKHQGAFTVRLILPSPDFFPTANTRDHDFAEAMFAQTRAFMGLSDWACRLVPQSEDDDVQTALRQRGVEGESQRTSAAGTFVASQGDIEITYSPRLLNDPSSLVATLAHELCHYLMATVETEPPCGWADHELLTDLAAVHEGFGVFLCNTAFQFSQWSDSTYAGWRYSSQGYLNTAELGFALGIFCVRNQIDPELAMSHLKLNPGEVFWDSIGYIEELEKRNAR